eukprot:scaffold51265_cov27-Phaeocystis_antarctica.AAC.1
MRVIVRLERTTRSSQGTAPTSPAIAYIYVICCGYHIYDEEIYMLWLYSLWLYLLWLTCESRSRGVSATSSSSVRRSAW